MLKLFLGLKNFGQREDLCPACNHPLIRKSFNSLNIRNLYECSNEKELCDFKQII